MREDRIETGLPALVVALSGVATGAVLLLGVNFSSTLKSVDDWVVEAG